MRALNLNDAPLHLHEWAELDHIAALERHHAAQRAGNKLTAADLDAADARRAIARRVQPSAPRRSLLGRIKRTARIAWLHWTISSNEEWLAHARRDGVLTSDNLRMVRRELEALRVDLAVEQGAAS